MSNGNTWPSYMIPPYGVNMPVQANSFNPAGTQGPYSFYPPQMASGGGGGGWLNNAMGFMAGPGGMAATAGLGLIGGLISGLTAGKKRKQARKALEKGQKAYQSKAEQLFPELSKESFMYQNPGQTNAINAGLSYMLNNMFGSWGMPQGMNQGYGNMAQFFQNLMPGLPTATTPTNRQLPSSKKGRTGGGGQGGRGGWYNDFRSERGSGPRQMFAI